MRRLAAVLVAVLVAVGCLPDPGTPCPTPTDYRSGWWWSADGTPIAHAPTEDSAPTVWACTPNADTVILQLQGNLQPKPQQYRLLQ